MSHSDGQKKRFLVTGADGMLGVAICSELTQRGYHVQPTGFNSSSREVWAVDVRDWGSVSKAVQDCKPEFVIHLAAETDVDRCEHDPDHAFATNAMGTENIAWASREADAAVIYVSTANVFDGRKSEPYCEFDSTGSLNVYGRSKLEGERVVETASDRYFILRAGWMVGGWEIDKKFVYKIVQLCQTESQIKAVSDKFGSPTFTGDFAKNMMDLLETKRYGLYHMANEGTGSRFDIAREVVAALGKQNQIDVRAVSSDDFPMAAVRPRSEMLRNMKLGLLGMNNMPHWKESLRRYIAENRRNDDTY